ncbi:peroxidase 43-like isoform X1 [Lycium barbarum]|uniref:peroxidase 43-like isoform X1 n=1 Tax=Lycium barbarum TaxID=112863 RepID=UPI00293E81B5|nr:peroxidase 43-like isoform X1 [Lycium barbarum]
MALLKKNAKSFIKLISIICFLQVTALNGQLRVGFYSQRCHNVESIVSSVVKEASQREPRMPAMLLRLHFHDCFVQGCDGSILIDHVKQAEKNAFGHEGLEGFAEIQKAKTQLEAKCPGVVSCADIIALAARDAVVLAGGPFYEVETGRRDGRVSDLSFAAKMPEVDDSVEVLKEKFKTKGFTEKELVILSAGAHTIGTTACFFMPKRLYNFTGKLDADPSINPKFLPELRRKCPKNGNINVRISLDNGSERKFDDQILHNIKNGFAVIASDARLYDDNITRAVVDSYLQPQSPNRNSSSFGKDFGLAMVKLGRLEVKTGLLGEIRKVCNSFNKK